MKDLLNFIVLLIAYKWAERDKRRPRDFLDDYEDGEVYKWKDSSTFRIWFRRIFKR